MNRRDSSSTIVGSLEKIRRELLSYLGVPKRKKVLPDPLDLLIATILSQNTNDVNSHKAFTNLKAAHPDFSRLAKISPVHIERLIKVGGIARKKSRTIVKVIRHIESDFPDFSRRSLRKMAQHDLVEQLRELPGVGYKTAACVSLFALGDNDAFPVDTHVHRILNRIGVVHEKTPDKTYLAVRDNIPAGGGYDLHINLIKFGRTICTALKPKCGECPLYSDCKWNGKISAARNLFRINPDKKVSFMLLESV